jgi:type VI secretion system protein VasD
MKRRVVLVLAAGSTLAACGMFGGGAEKKELSVEMTLAAGNQLNPNAQRRPSPVVVRVFDLKTPAGFEAANYDGLFERDRETLAAELVQRDEFILNPGEAKKMPDRKLAPETKVLGIAVGFRELERASWRTTVTLKPNTRNRINVNVDGVTVIATLVP